MGNIDAKELDLEVNKVFLLNGVPHIYDGCQIKPHQEVQTVYFKIQKNHENYKGIRFFRVDPNQTYVTQVCVNSGYPKKGRGHNRGIYEIAHTTFYCNYISPNYVSLCSKDEFDQALLTTIKLLS